MTSRWSLLKVLKGSGSRGKQRGKENLNSEAAGEEEETNTLEIEKKDCDKRETNRVRDRGREGRNRGVLECRKPMEREME